MRNGRDMGCPYRDVQHESRGDLTPFTRFKSSQEKGGKDQESGFTAKALRKEMQSWR